MILGFESQGLRLRVFRIGVAFSCRTPNGMERFLAREAYASLNEVCGVLMSLGGFQFLLLPTETALHSRRLNISVHLTISIFVFRSVGVLIPVAVCSSSSFCRCVRIS